MRTPREIARETEARQPIPKVEALRDMENRLNDLNTREYSLRCIIQEMRKGLRSACTLKEKVAEHTRILNQIFSLADRIQFCKQS